MRELARKHPRFGYRRVAALLRAGGWRVNNKRVRRLWRREGLKIPRKVRKKRRLGHDGNGCTRRRAVKINEVWSYDFVFDQTADGRPLKILPVVDEYTRECLVMLVGRSLTARDVIGALAQAARERGMPEHLRSDNGPEFIATAVRRWLAGGGDADAVHRAGQPVGERVQRVVQQPAAGRAAQRRAVQQREGGGGAVGAASPGLQRGAATQFAGVRRPGGVRSAVRPGEPGQGLVRLNNRSNRNSHTTWTKKRGHLTAPFIQLISESRSSDSAQPGGPTRARSLRHQARQDEVDLLVPLDQGVAISRLAVANLAWSGQGPLLIADDLHSVSLVLGWVGGGLVT